MTWISSAGSRMTSGRFGLVLGFDLFMLRGSLGATDKICPTRKVRL